MDSLTHDCVYKLLSDGLRGGDCVRVCIMGLLSDRCSV